MRFCKLRIAWSVVWGVLAVLLIALWVRSYWRCDLIDFRTISGHHFQIGHARGILGCGGDANLFSLPWSITKWDIASDVTRGDETIQGHFGFTFEAVLSFGTVATAPHWFAVMLCAIVAAAPWIRWKWRFSLRTLLIATTLIAVVMGLIVSLL
jgi:hypothetical protein